MAPRPKEPQTERTRHLARAQRQWFQWYWREGLSKTKVRKLFDELSEDLAQRNEPTYIASQSQWDSRHREWNKVWQLKSKDRGLHQLMPANLMHLPLWRAEGKDVGDWRIMEPSARSGSIASTPDDNTAYAIDKDLRYIDVVPLFNMNRQGNLRMPVLFALTNSNVSTTQDISSFHPSVIATESIDSTLGYTSFGNQQSQNPSSAANSIVNSMTNDSLSTTGYHSDDLFSQHKYGAACSTYQAPTQSSTRASSAYRSYPIPSSTIPQAPDGTPALSTTPLAAHVAIQSQSPLNDQAGLYDWLQTANSGPTETRYDGPQEEDTLDKYLRDSFMDV